jgi:U6 snRNA-associated Sm-like protein LSm3
METLDEPLDLLRLALAQHIYIKLRNNREIKGKLISYDSHLNMILCDVEETFLNNQIKEKRKFKSLYLRGDAIILVSQLSKGIIEM